jgi:hypothetical protein
MSPAKAIAPVKVIDGKSYQIIIENVAAKGNERRLQDNPWWNKEDLAKKISGEYSGAYYAFGLTLSTVDKFEYYHGSAKGSAAMKDTKNYAFAVPVPFEISGRTTIPAMGALLLAARWKARRSISSKTRTANPDVAVP